MDLDTTTNMLLREVTKFIDKCYEELSNMEMGDSYIIVDGKRIEIDTGYAFEGVQIFIEYLKKKMMERD